MGPGRVEGSDQEKDLEKDNANVKRVKNTRGEHRACNPESDDEDGNNRHCGAILGECTTRFASLSKPEITKRALRTEESITALCVWLKGGGGGVEGREANG